MKSVVVVLLSLFALNAVHASDLIRALPSWKDRSYKLHIPPRTRGPIPLVLAIHGAGGNWQSQERLTCPGGDLTNSKCLNALADRMGVAVVYPNGTGALDACKQDPKWCEFRTWNAGGGTLGFSCVGGYACEHQIDDVAYFKDLIADVRTLVSIDSSRIFATGISNGAAMSFRLACEMSEQIAAIAPVAGGNQFLPAGNCRPKRAISLLQIHGSADGTWPYYGGASNLGVVGLMFSIQGSVLHWLQVNGCNPGAGK
ncbi:MAG: PHB depolymerase family esterase, partial [Bdellovibrionia bacterium]